MLPKISRVCLKHLNRLSWAVFLRPDFCYNYSMTVQQLKKELRRLASADKAVGLARFFKTGPGQYGAGDRFLGVMVPQQRLLAKQCCAWPLGDIAGLLASPWHEERLVGLLILVEQFARGPEAKCREIFKFYVSHRAAINNWDLVDLSAGKIAGAWLVEHRDLLFFDRFIQSTNLWERRLAIIASSAFIARGEFALTFRLVKKLLADPHDLLHKAAGWMLREIGKRDRQALRDFIERYGGQMPRVMLRYAIEHWPAAERAKILRGKTAQQK